MKSKIYCFIILFLSTVAYLYISVSIYLKVDIFLTLSITYNHFRQLIQFLLIHIGLAPFQST